MVRFVFLACIAMSSIQLLAQSAEYEQLKKEKLANPSPFEKIVTEQDDRVIIYQDDLVVVFEPLTKQAPVHLLIVPKKRIPTLNDVAPSDEAILGRMVTTASKMASQYGIDKTGYRISINTNEDAGQSVFHIHLHLLGGRKLGPMVLRETK